MSKKRKKTNQKKEKKLQKNLSRQKKLSAYRQKRPLQRQHLGKKGEDLATLYLKKQNYHIIKRNIRIGRREIDIIASSNDVLVFIEVKTRSSDHFGLPIEAVTKQKYNEIKKAAESYLSLHKGSYKNVRIDVIGILLTGNEHTITHIKGA